MNMPSPKQCLRSEILEQLSWEVLTLMSPKTAVQVTGVTWSFHFPCGSLTHLPIGAGCEQRVSVSCHMDICTGLPQCPRDTWLLLLRACLTPEVTPEFSTVAPRLRTWACVTGEGPHRTWAPATTHIYCTIIQIHWSLSCFFFFSFIFFFFFFLEASFNRFAWILP
jgi:hypothetical protein